MSYSKAAHVLLAHRLSLSWSRRQWVVGGSVLSFWCRAVVPGLQPPKDLTEMQSGSCVPCPLTASLRLSTVTQLYGLAAWLPLCESCDNNLIITCRWVAPSYNCEVLPVPFCFLVTVNSLLTIRGGSYDYFNSGLNTPFLPWLTLYF